MVVSRLGMQFTQRAVYLMCRPFVLSYYFGMDSEDDEGRSRRLATLDTYERLPTSDLAVEAVMTMLSLRPCSTMLHAFFHTTASFEEGNIAKRQKLEPEFDDVSEPSQLSGPSPKAKVHCVVTAVSNVRLHARECACTRPYSYP